MLTAFDSQLYFHAMVLLCREVGGKNLDIIRYAVYRTLACLAVELLQKTLDTLAKSCSIGPLWLYYSSTCGPISS